MDRRPDAANGTSGRRIPDATVRRLPAYLRTLEEAGDTRFTSQELGRRTGFSSEQVRKDLAHFGAFGTRGVGYEARLLAGEIRRILGLDAGLRAVLIGVGHLGTALANFIPGTHKDVQIVGLFDADPKKVGTEVAGSPIWDIDRLDMVVARESASLGIIAVPSEAAQSVAEQLMAAGVRGILNFAPTALVVPDSIYVRNIDLSLELQALAYFVQAEAVTTPPG
jgi:redox-sensing transcriptional repressor